MSNRLYIVCLRAVFSIRKFAAGSCASPGRSRGLAGSGAAQALVLFALGMAVALAGCSCTPSAPTAGVDSISGERMLAAIKTLSSDEFEGRGPGSKGEQLTIDYIQKQFKDMGAKPGNPDGSYLQNVPFVGITADPDMKLTFSGKREADYGGVSERFYCLDETVGGFGEAGWRIGFCGIRSAGAGIPVERFQECGCERESADCAGE